MYLSKGRKKREYVQRKETLEGHWRDPEYELFWYSNTEAGCFIAVGLNIKGVAPESSRTGRNSFPMWPSVSPN